MKKLINDLLAEHKLIMLYVANKNIYWLRKHYIYLDKREMLNKAVRVKLGPNNIKMKEGLNYITQPYEKT